MKALLNSQDCWDVEEGYVKPKNAVAEATLTNEEKRVLKEARKKDKRLFFIFQGVDESTFEKISDVKTLKEAWEILQKSLQGAKKSITNP
ncbi:hypothetical protein J1N35_041797 [Gossypium stocksii]|uniref:Uncharacterized protein n=1 Tax=Gossypium stocksii TaxID=47602 RepID=A0A9D3UG68_9ROSI|nr:hypothetical protein J1N35_041797 [Gossypium stocksii]